MKEIQVLIKNSDLLNNLLYRAKEKLQFSEDPKIVFIIDKKNSSEPLGKTGFYDPRNKKIAIFILNRHFKDILRTLAHELIHHLQNTRGDLQKLNNIEEGYFNSNSVARELEREAYEQGNMLFREWEDEVKYK
jgi:Zn-dependent peptidase ImmA (M78 family)